MEKTETTQATLRKRKMLVVMPLLVIPFLTMGFWALGGGKGIPDGKGESPTGLNPVLPDARLKEEKLEGKLSFYDKAQKDSVKLAEWMRSDPYYRSQPISELPAGGHPSEPSAASDTSLNGAPFGGTRPEEQIMEKLAKLQKGLDAPPAPKERISESPGVAERKGELSREVDRLEHLMEGMKRGSLEDPGMERIESVMDKMLDIQHPERVRRRLEEAPQEDKEAVKELQVEPAPTYVSLLLAPQQQKEPRSGFYSEEKEKENENNSTAIPAVVHGDQTLTDGTVVKLRLTGDIYLGEAHIPKGSFVYGRASLGKERLLISIASLLHNNSLYTVSLEVYDLDGMAGLSIPGALEKAVVGESAHRSLAGLELPTLDPSLKAKAASAGLSTAKNLLSRKAKQVKVTLKGGYQVLLKDKKSKP